MSLPLSSPPAKPFNYRDEWLQTQTYPSASPQYHNRLPSAVSLPRPVTTKTSIHTLGYSYDNVAAISVHSAASRFSSPEACDCPSSNSSSASYSQPASPHRSITRSSEIPVSELGATGINTDGNQRPQEHLGPDWRHWRRATVCCHSSLANNCGIEERTPSILIFLALINPLLSLISALYTLLILFFLILCLPLQICSPTSTFAVRLTRYLYPTLSLHFTLIYSLAGGQPDSCNPIRLVLLHLTSPLLAFGTAVCAWVAAVFWVYAAMLGDPDGRGIGDDGRRAVLSVRRYWERILCWVLR